MNEGTNEGTYTTWDETTGTARAIPISQLPPLKRDALHREMVAKREQVLHLMGKQGGLSSVVLVISGVQMVQG